LPWNANAEGVKSRYTEVVQSLLKEDKPASNTFFLKCWEDPENDLYMGIEQRVRIHAKFDEVNRVVSAIEEYDQLFPDYEKIYTVSKTENRFTVSFEQKVPIFFVPNVKFQMLYTELTPSSDKKIFWYQLKEADVVKNSDGFILLKKVSENETDYTEYDFFDAHWGAAKVKGKASLWKDVVDGIYRSDLAVKIKAEDPKLKSIQAQKRAKEERDTKLVDQCVKDRSLWK
jgi:hypothetical protein